MSKKVVVWLLTFALVLSNVDLTVMAAEMQNGSVAVETVTEKSTLEETSDRGAESEKEGEGAEVEAAGSDSSEGVTSQGETGDQEHSGMENGVAGETQKEETPNGMTEETVAPEETTGGTSSDETAASGETAEGTSDETAAPEETTEGTSEETTAPEETMEETVGEATDEETTGETDESEGLNAEEEDAEKEIDDAEEELSFEQDEKQATSYDLYTAADVVNIANDLAGNYTLKNDISLAGISDWIPLGTFTEPFSGTLDGAGYTLSGLTIKNGVAVVDTTYGMGLFGRNNGTIKNLKVEGTTSGETGYYRSLVAAYNTGTLQDITVTGTVVGGQYSGLLTGYNTKPVENCQGDGSVTSAGGSYIGGLIGYNTGSVTNCKMKGSISASGSGIGGLVGNNNGGAVKSCEAECTVSGSNNIGGLVGYNSGTVEDSRNKGERIYGSSSCVGGFIGQSTDTGMVRNCRTESTVESHDSSCGGFVGYNRGTVEVCKASSSVSSTYYSNHGGFAGYNEGIIVKCFMEGTVSGENRTGGFAGYSKGTIRYCATTATVTGEGYTGGFVGYLEGNSVTTNCYATGNVTASADYAGGFAGSVESTGAVLLYSYSAGAVSCGYDHAGGFAGANKGTVNYCYYDKETSKREDTGKGTPLDTASMLTSSAYVGWDFDTVWAMAPSVNGGYPYLSALVFGETLTPHVPVTPSASLTGAGTVGSPYLIASEADLLAVGRDLSAYYRLEADIAVTDFWKPFGTFTEPFSGSLDGNGHTISGLLIKTGVAVADTTYGMGLFGRNNGTIKNLKVDGTVVGETGYYRSLVAAYNTGTLQDISVTGTVVGGQYSGLLTGYNTKPVENCQGDGSVTSAGGSYIGGLIGYNTGSVTNCKMKGSVSASGSGIGGLVGNNYGGAVKSCEAECTVSGSNNIGGLVGYNSGTVEDSRNKGERIYGSSSCVGGFIGQSTDTGIVRNCRTESRVVSHDSSCGGFVGYNRGTVEVCKASSSVSSTYYSNHGGFAGYNEGIIVKCFIEGTVSGKNRTGGFAGYSKGTIRYCATTATVTGEGYTGGFVGYLEGNSVTTNCYATGNVTASADYAGGFAGSVESASSVVSYSYSVGQVSCGYDHKGGFAGTSSAPITTCYYDSDTSRQEDTGKGIPVEDDAMMQQDTYTGWDFAIVWGLDSEKNEGYPYLRVLDESESVTIVSVTGVTLDQTSASLMVGETVKLTETIAPADATDKNVTWTSSNTSVATVENGLVTAVAKGSATITVTTIDGKKAATCTVTVSTVVPVTGVTLDKTSADLKVGETVQLTAKIAPIGATNKNITWISSDTAIATVVDGLVTAVAKGDTTITVTTEDGTFTATCAVKISPAIISVTGVMLDKTSTDLKVGETVQLTAQIAPADATNQNITWTSSDTAVATVVDGLVTAVAKGSVTITVTTEDGTFTATCAVTVSSAATDQEPGADPGTEDPGTDPGTDPETPPSAIPVTGVTLDKTSASLTVGETIQLVATIAPTDATNKKLTWTSSNMSAATVKEGVVSAVAKGSTVITVTTEDGNFTASCNVTVRTMAGGDALWIEDIPDYTYCGAEVKPVIKVHYGDAVLVEKVDYTVSYKNNTKAANTADEKVPTVSVVGKGNYSGIAERIFNINKLDVSHASLASDHFPKGKKYTPVITCQNESGSFVLKSGTDYTIQYDGGATKQPTDAGDHTMTITGKDNCDGVVTFNYTIADAVKSIDKAKAKVSSMSYGGNLPTVSLKLGRNLNEGTEFMVVFSNTDKKGTAKATFIGIGEYCGTKTVSFKVKTAKIQKANVSVETKTAYSKGGAKPDVVVEVGDRTLINGVDYSVSYSKNSKLKSKAKVTVKGKGNYTGKVTKTFTVVGKDLCDEDIQIFVSDVKTGMKPTVTIYDGNGKKLKAKSDYKAVVDLNDSVVKITGGSNKLYSASSDIEIPYKEVNKDKLITSAELKADHRSYIYSGEPITLEENWIEVKAGTVVLASDEYEIVGYIGNVNKGKATVVIKAKEDSEYGGLKFVTFEIGAMNLR